jgi:phage replication-related protein YjqB (UPF0714/DUF867 family)
VGAKWVPEQLDVRVKTGFPPQALLLTRKHTVKVAMSGFKDWSRDITTQAGSEAYLAAIVEKLNQAGLSPSALAASDI